MKKLIALLLVLVMVLGLVACGAKEAPKTEEKKEETSAPATEEKKEETKTEEKKEETSAPATEAGTLVLGGMFDLTGPNANIGIDYRRAVELAVNEINKKGGLNGEQIELLVYDDKGTPEEAAKIGEKMVADGVEVAIVSNMKSLIYPAVPALNDAGILIFGNSGSDTLMDLENYPYLYRGCAGLEFMQPSMIETWKTMGITKVALFSSQLEANLALMENITKRAEEAGIEIVCQEFAPAEDTDYSGQIANIINSEPEGVFFAISGNPQASFIKQLRQFGYEDAAFCFEAIGPDIIQAAGEASDNVIYCYPYVINDSIDDYTDPYMIEFQQLYFDTYGVLPVNYAPYYGWDSVIVLEEAARIAGTNDVDAITASIDKISGLQACGGIFDYTAGNHECLSSFPGYIIVDGTVGPLDAWLESGAYETLKAEVR